MIEIWSIKANLHIDVSTFQIQLVRKKYDAIIFAGALSHFPNLKIVKNIDKILKKNGIMCMGYLC